MTNNHRHTCAAGKLKVGLHRHRPSLLIFTPTIENPVTELSPVRPQMPVFTSVCAKHTWDNWHAHTPLISTGATFVPIGRCLRSSIRLGSTRWTRIKRGRFCRFWAAARTKRPRRPPASPGTWAWTAGACCRCWDRWSPADLSRRRGNSGGCAERVCRRSLSVAQQAIIKPRSFHLSLQPINYLD